MEWNGISHWEGKVMLKEWKGCLETFSEHKKVKENVNNFLGGMTLSPGTSKAESDCEEGKPLWVGA